eukprot:4677851-Pleurochrysis_carterae.AAC.1
MSRSKSKRALASTIRSRRSSSAITRWRVARAGGEQLFICDDRPGGGRGCGGSRATYAERSALVGSRSEIELIGIGTIRLEQLGNSVVE